MGRYWVSCTFPIGFTDLYLSRYSEHTLLALWCEHYFLFWAQIRRMCLIYTYMFIFYFCLFGGTGHFSALTHWGRVTHICVSKLNIIASDNGLSPGRRQAIIWTSARILLIGSVGTNFSEILIEIIIFSFKKMRLKVLSAKWRPCCLGLNVLTQICKSRHCDYHCTATTDRSTSTEC